VTGDPNQVGEPVGTLAVALAHAQKLLASDPARAAAAGLRRSWIIESPKPRRCCAA
jgi:hypothetical protein